jgi:hypothetical protein
MGSILRDHRVSDTVARLRPVQLNGIPPHGTALPGV